MLTRAEQGRGTNINIVISSKHCPFLTHGVCELLTQQVLFTVLYNILFILEITLLFMVHDINWKFKEK